MNKLILTLTLIVSVNSFALTCETDSECLSEGISLIKKATKLKACEAEIKAAAGSIENVATAGSELSDLEKCVVRAKKAAKVAKKFDKRLARIKKAMGN